MIAAAPPARHGARTGCDPRGERPPRMPARRDPSARRPATSDGRPRPASDGRPRPASNGSPRPASNGSPRSRIVEIQRLRVLAATARLACEQGAGNVTVASIVARAGISRRTFYEIFGDAEACLLAAMHDALERVRRQLLPAWESQGAWSERLRRALVELLRLLDEDPVLAQLLLVESLAAGRGIQRQRASVLDSLTAAIDQGRHRARATASAGPSRLTAEGVLGGVLSVLHARLTQPQPGRLAELAGPLMSMIVLPYHGAAAARRELARPVPAAASRRETLQGDVSQSLSSAASDPFRDAGMRLTYRTLRVLSAIAQQPGSSNKALAAQAHVADQGQISKLLARLERIGLVANDGGGHARGEANAWALTAAGEQIANSLRVRPEERLA